MPESAGCRRLCHTESVLQQQTPADLEPVLIEEINGSLLQTVPEDAAAFAPADIPRGGDIVQGDPA